MDEHMFLSGDWASDDAEATTRAADLAELVLDEVSRREHDWRAVNTHTRVLDELASLMARRYGPGCGADPSPPQPSS